MGRLMIERHGYRVKNTLVELRTPSEAESPYPSTTVASERDYEGDDVTEPEAPDIEADHYGSQEAWDYEGCWTGYDSGMADGVSGTLQPSTPSPLMRPALLPPGMGYLPPFQLGMSAACSLGVPGYNEQGVPGFYIPTMPFEQACGFFMHPGFAMEEQGMLEEDTLAAASQQTELLLEALSEKLLHSKHGHASSQEIEQELPVCPETAAWQSWADEVPPEGDQEPLQAAEQPDQAADAQEPVPEAEPAGAQEEQEVLEQPIEAVVEEEPAQREVPCFREKERNRGGGTFGDSRPARQARRRRGAEAGQFQEEWGCSRSSGVVDSRQGISVTTVMLRNIPNKYTRDMLVDRLSLHFRGKFDFLYLPIDFKNACNVGYGFINFRTVEACRLFVSRFSGVDVSRCLPGISNSSKVAEVTPARVQGLEDNVKRLRGSAVMQELIKHPEWMPLTFDKEGVQSLLHLPDGPVLLNRPRCRQRGCK
uniref:RRM domain-containing protein n=1 Tax=Alexandrium monilatum TaxID=311494 RepID=A0A7S4Q685_9DINO|mmetsp:Transcript_108700/g.346564  ORF Transcript_108700/g.346564 Transcript_108700/m.346564 type:complete len:479 (-) Transcript_108700:53-1489(-)